MEILPGMLVIFGPVVILGLALAGEACLEKLSRVARRFNGLRSFHFG